MRKRRIGFTTIAIAALLLCAFMSGRRHGHDYRNHPVPDMPCTGQDFTWAMVLAVIGVSASTAANALPLKERANKA